MAFTKEKATQAAEIVKRAKAQIEKVRETTEEAMADTLLIAETSATTFGLAYANARWGEHGELKVIGVPVDLGLATALGGLSLLGGFGKYKEHGRNIGLGALATYVNRLGVERGGEAARGDEDDSYKRTLGAGRKPAGALGSGSAGTTATKDTAGQTYVVADH
jgi:hypothetical protein